MARWNVIVMMAIFFLFGNYNYLEIGNASKFYGEKLSQSHPLIGTTFLFICILLLLFSDEIFVMIKKKKIKIKKDF